MSRIKPGMTMCKASTLTAVLSPQSISVVFEGKETMVPLFLPWKWVVGTSLARVWGSNPEAERFKKGESLELWNCLWGLHSRTLCLTPTCRSRPACVWSESLIPSAFYIGSTKDWAFWKKDVQYPLIKLLIILGVSHIVMAERSREKGFRKGKKLSRNRR